MANRRELKKDINWLLEEIFADCIMYIDINNIKDSEPVAKIMDKLISKRDDVLSTINKPTSKMQRKEVKNLYKETVGSYLTTASECIDELSKLPR